MRKHNRPFNAAALKRIAAYDWESDDVDPCPWGCPPFWRPRGSLVELPDDVVLLLFQCRACKRLWHEYWRVSVEEPAASELLGVHPGHPSWAATRVTWT